MKVLAAALQAHRQGRPAALVTVIGVAGSAPRGSGTRMLVYADGSIVGTVGGGAFELRLMGLAREAIADGRCRRDAVHLAHDLGMCCGGQMEAFIEPLPRRDHLVIYGGGHVGAAVARLAIGLAFDVTVVDEREAFADPQRFEPRVRVLEDDPRRRLDAMPFGDSAYHLIVTHSHQLDQDLLEALIDRPLAWLGLIGSRAKIARFFVRLQAAGVDPALFSRVSAPVGLAIGAESPAEIAVSFLAEMFAVGLGVASAAALSQRPRAARGGDGRATPPRLSSVTDSSE